MSNHIKSSCTPVSFANTISRSMMCLTRRPGLDQPGTIAAGHGTLEDHRPDHDRHHVSLAVRLVQFVSVCDVDPGQSSLGADRRHRGTVGDRRISQRARFCGINLFGIAVLSGIVLVSYIDHIRQGMDSVKQAVVHGCMSRLLPVLMTATVALLALTPLALATGMGSEVQRPLAVGSDRWSLDFDRLDAPCPSHSLSVV
jgi:hypothetical protein